MTIFAKSMFLQILPNDYIIKILTNNS